MVDTRHKFFRCSVYVLLLSSFARQMGLNSSFGEINMGHETVDEELPERIGGAAEYSPKLGTVNLCTSAKKDFKNSSGLWAIVTGLPHSGTTITSQLLMSAPNIYGGVETGLLLASNPADFVSVKPFYDWLVLPATKKFWGLDIEQQQMLLNVSCHAEMYSQLRRMSPLFKHEINRGSWILDKTPEYIYNLTAVMDRAPGIPVVVVQKSYEDQLISFKHKRKVRNPEYLIQRGMTGVQAATNAYGEQIHILNMTEFYVNPDKVMKGAFDFLNLQWDNKYLSMDAVNAKSVPGSSMMNSVDFAAPRNAENITSRFSDAVP